ncbi:MULTISPECIES: potassium-transporting ATPase subunit KdpC [Edwardsiella]|uniref:Potassium-transporting ATPase KdpC subunit n=2 Tax=Edwardsiella anguillarum TaxID=1821960 RepID=A0A076LGC2_9GAMM|nr:MULTISPECIES: potassium-transporting ATPase subunit KdpC [Edwardsiella]AKM47195.1 potassium-transporting ATPase subunit C [Edwardsiella sp. EA181011]GAJ68972.1 K+-transporting ATPase subunit C [Edwardsiella piscicida]AIJ07171.1 Potassium-transporting ATPase C chain [Edwardsiella anguillarum ET080813]AKR78524.2 potassium-transporting ATPase subunit KdpC [Edwardsiella sp. LADL05-105]KAB0590974.1 potassium-transporting ATPase subunit KdpC [Edwardsiella anguillarum]
MTQPLLRPTLVMMLVLTLITGILYPLLTTALAQLMFPLQANGSLLLRDGRPVGSALIGQPFQRDDYFWPRPSATAGHPYNAMASGGSNLAVSNPLLTRTLAARAERLRQRDAQEPVGEPIPVDLLTSSASGLDPDISPQAAHYQAARIAAARGLALSRVDALIADDTEPRWPAFLGQPTVNVLRLNLALDRLSSEATPRLR